MNLQQNNSAQYIQYLQGLLIQNKIQFKILEKFKQKKQKSIQQVTNNQKKQFNEQKQNTKLQNTKLSTNMKSNLSGKLVERYCRQMLLKQIAYQGQQKIINSKIAIIGCGGIGCPLAMYLAGAGVGTLGLFDSDIVDVTNLHRQIGHRNKSVGISKTQSLKRTLLSFNPHIKIFEHKFITIETAAQLQAYDLIIDGSDNPQCRYIVNDYCMKINKKLLSGACIGWQGQITCYGGQYGPCYRCIWGNQQKTSGGCSTLGVVGMLPGFVGIILATQSIKMILNGSSSLEGSLLTYESKTANFRKMKLRNKVKDCIGCGQNKLNIKQYHYSKHAICKPNLSNLPTVPEITWKQYLQSISSKTKNIQQKILDVRPSNQFNIAHLQNMINLPYEKLYQMSQQQVQNFIINNKLKRQKQGKIFVSCNRGVMSKRAADFLIKLNNYQAVSIKGGITQYSKYFDSSIPLL